MGLDDIAIYKCIYLYSDIFWTLSLSTAFQELLIELLLDSIVLALSFPADADTRDCFRLSKYSCCDVANTCESIWLSSQSVRPRKLKLTKVITKFLQL